MNVTMRVVYYISKRVGFEQIWKLLNLSVS